MPAGAGLDASVVLRLLATDEDVAGIREKDAGFRKMGVSSVPTFIVNGQHAVPGAQSTDWWRDIIGEIRTQMQADPA